MMHPQPPNALRVTVAADYGNLTGAPAPRGTMKLLTVRHSTIYRYARPVELGRHRLMLRPRDSHDLRLVGAELTLSPPGDVRWVHDVFGNSVALVDFARAGAGARRSSATLSIERYALARPEFPIDPEAELYPFVYSSDDRTDLGRLLERHYPDPHGVVDEWAKQFAPMRPSGTLNVLASMNKAIHDSFAYEAREEEGTQLADRDHRVQGGSCRDFALLFIEAARSLGFGARFVSGYLYDPALDGGDRGAGRRRDPCLGRGLSARRRLGRIRPDQRRDRGREPDPRRGHARCRAGGADRRQLSAARRRTISACRSR